MAGELHALHEAAWRGRGGQRDPVRRTAGDDEQGPAPGALRWL